MIVQQRQHTQKPGLAVGLLLFCLALMPAGCRPAENFATGGPAQRIVSMAPSITELLFALDCGTRVVGVTSYCLYPGAAAQLPRVGGYYDVNYERILSLRPDLVLLPVEHVEAERHLRALGLSCRMIDTATIPAIFKAIDDIAAICGAEAAAAELTQNMQRRMNQITGRTRGRPPRKVLISIGRNMGSGGLSDVYLAGSGTMYDELLTMLGASNVFQGNLPYAQISQEAILRMNPDVIIDLAPELDRSTTLT
ncbi:MAG: helical backbone metal receptor, partial [Lentisphaerae bacterium]|nr:helical backbone metal receptor [Lentisphaerota bacterium]